MAKDRSYLRAVEGQTLASAIAATPEIKPAALHGMMAPEDLSETQREIWDRVILEGAGQFTAQHEHLLRVLVSAIDVHRIAVKKVAQVGSVIKSPSGYPIQNPYVADMNKQAATILSVSRELGLTPASKQRGKNPSARTRPGNPFGELRSLED